MATSPIVETFSLSNTGSQVVPLLVVFHTPPEAVPTYTIFGSLSTTAKSSMRPPITAGPISRNSRFLNLSVEFCGAPAVMRAPANRNPPQARMLGRALDLCFISLSSRARPGILLRSRALRTKLFLRTATNSDETDALGCGRVSCGSSRPLFSLFPFQAAVRRCRVPFLPITATHARLSSRSHPSHGSRESFLKADCDPSFPSLDGTPRHGFASLSSPRHGAADSSAARQGPSRRTRSQSADDERRPNHGRRRCGDSLRGHAAARRPRRIQRQDERSRGHRPRAPGLPRRVSRSHRSLLTDGTRSPQGGQQQRLEIQSLLPHGWRFVTDYNHLSSLTFRLAFADTFGDAINAEVQSALFLTNNFRGFSLNLAGINDKSFLTLPVEGTPATTVTLRNLPQARFGSVEQAPWHKIPLYFSLDSFVGAVHRADSVPPTPSYTPIDTPLSVPREEFAPRVTLPVHFGPWFGATASAAFRATRYGDSLNAAGVVSGTAIVRNTGEFAVELRPPSFERFFGTKKNKLQRRYKHSIEPAITYRYVTGVNNFADFIRFDSDATLTDTSEVEYGFTQRLYRKDGGDQPQELISWRIAQKHYFDPTFGGAMVNGQRNVFQALDSISPFAFAFGPRNWSPIISDFKLTPGGPYDLEQILQYDPEIQRLATIGTLVKAKPYREFFATIAYFRLNENPSPGDIASLPPPQVCVPANEPCPFQQPLSNQIRALVGYGSENRKGFNFTGGVGYDFTKQTLQNQIVQASYNGSCCGLALEYRRLNLSTVRTENQFRVAFILANIGTFGNLRHRDKIF